MPKSPAGFSQKSSKTGVPARKIESTKTVFMGKKTSKPAATYLVAKQTEKVVEKDVFDYIFELILKE